MEDKNKLHICIRSLFFLWFFLIVFFGLEFLEIVSFFKQTSFAGIISLILFNLLFLSILIVFHYITKEEQLLLKKEKDVVFWQYHQISALANLINKTGKALTTVLNKDKLMRLILESFIKIFHGPAGFLLLYNENENIFEYEAGYGINRTNLKYHVIKNTHPVIADIINNYRIVTQHDISNLTNKNIQFLKPDKLKKIAKGIDTLITITLRIGDKIFGIVFLYAAKTSALIISEYETPVHIAINQATIAIGSAIQTQFAIQDRLTMLYNHDYFIQRLKEEIFRCKRYKLKLCLMMLDIDHFKSFNDTYGHLAGNHILREVSNIFKENTRITDLVARYGGEEFSIMMTETTMNDALQIAEKIRQSIYDYPFEYEDQKLHVTISIGISQLDGSKDNTFDSSDFINVADKNLYEAKRSGRNRVCS
ncbi:MAG: GGDEF domain-containing protein [Candidatus Aureabacteria bacterium]|nr:GGDEF domain-containing protein [Candidatus Auribacterota bacterium]